MKWYLLKLWSRCFKVETFADLMHVSGILFDSGVEEDLGGQLLIYTGLEENLLMAWDRKLQPHDPDKESFSESC